MGAYNKLGIQIFDFHDVLLVVLNKGRDKCDFGRLSLRRQVWLSMGEKYEVEERRKAPEDAPGWWTALPGLVCWRPLSHKATV